MSQAALDHLEIKEIIAKLTDIIIEIIKTILS